MKKKLYIIPMMLFAGMAFAQNTTQQVTPKKERIDFWQKNEKELGLSADQVRELQTAHSRLKADMKVEKDRLKSAKKQTKAAAKAEREAYQNELKRILTKDQYIKYLEMQQKKMHKKRAKAVRKMKRSQENGVVRPPLTR